MEEKVKISLVIATFNSQKILPQVLESVKQQDFPQDKIEILVVDGGSTDKTIEIAKEFSCRIIDNPRTEPVYAKFLAYTKARGGYILYLDHDEVIENSDSLSNKLAILEENDSVKAVAGSGYKNPPGYPGINNYINEFGDPFSFFIYRLSKENQRFTKQMNRRYPKIKEDTQGIIFNFSQIKKLPLIELCAAGSMVDLNYMKREFPETLKKPELIPHFFYLLISRQPYLAVTKEDSLIHYSADNFKKYLTKISWRVKNNIHHQVNMGSSGFSGRNKFQPPWLRLKKYLFVPYSFSIIFPLIDGVYLAISRRKIFYLIHLFLSIYTASSILYNYLIKVLNFKPSLKSYDGTKTIKSKNF